jgi:GTP-binding protein
MFFDRTQINVAAGRGGNGCISFRREAHVPKGGPDGGDGGRGGDVVLVCDGSLRDLARFRGRANYAADDGRPGEGNRRHGASGEDCELHVPPGTKLETGDGELIAEVTKPGQRVTVARGGSGGRGNKHFATSTQQAPRFAEYGLPGEQRDVTMQLRLLADAGLIGLPNAGKSSLLDRMTAAAPKIADYPFTTLEPVLGTIAIDERQLVVVDIPGLIEGAHEGAGLGHEFLAHVERCRLLVHVLDVAPIDGSDPQDNYLTIEQELRQYDQRLARLPRILALSKADLVPPEQSREAVSAWRERLGDAVLDVVVTSAATGAGLDDLRAAIFRHVPHDEQEPEEPAPWRPGGTAEEDERPDHLVYRPAEGSGYSVRQVEPGVFTVEGRGIELLIKRFDIDNDEALRYVEGRLKAIGVVRELERQGFVSGDEIEIAGQRFAFEV